MALLERDQDALSIALLLLGLFWRDDEAVERFIRDELEELPAVTQHWWRTPCDICSIAGPVLRTHS